MAVKIAEWPLPKLNKILDVTRNNQADPDGQEQRFAVAQFLADFELDGRIVDVAPGPRFTTINLKLGPEVKLAQFQKLEPDLALYLQGRLERIDKPGAGSPYLSLIVENERHHWVQLQPVLNTGAYQTHEGLLKIALGVDTAGRPVVADLAALPHLLIGGAPNSGKSACVRAILASLLCTYAPPDVQVVLVDPIAVELQAYAALPHLFVPLVTDLQQVLEALDEVIIEIETRYEHLVQFQVRDIATYNRRLTQVGQKQMPYLVVVLDNVADLMARFGKPLADRLTRIAQKARAAGVHVVLATVRAKTDTLAGSIKANFPARLAFKVTDSAESRLILDESGAERLHGYGDMLYKAPNVGVVRRVQGVYVTDGEINRLVQHWQDT